MTRVRDLMQRNLITAAPSDSVSELIRTLEDAGISGAPVVGAEGALLGVVSSRDVMRLASEMGTVPEALKWGLGLTAPSRGEWLLETPEEGELFAYYVTPGGGFVDVRDRIREIPRDSFEGYSVADIMTPVPFTVTSDATLSELAHLLRTRKVHRALVVDEGRLEGIVTTMDVLRAVEEG